MDVLVTGAAGFIGYHVAKMLRERGDSVTAIDNFNEYYDPSLKRARASSLKKQGVNVIQADITDHDEMDKIFSQEDFSKVCHLAAQAGVRYSLENPFVYEKVNVQGMLNILELCRHHDVKDLVFASSSSVYGENKDYPFSEEQKLDTPISLYAATKKSNEEMAYVYHHLYGMNCTGLRFFTVYGPYGRPDMALFLFTGSILENKPIRVFNQGKMKRDFTYVEDIASGVLAALDKSYPYEIFNLGRGEPVGLMDFVKEIEGCLGKEAEKEFLPLQPGDVIETFADISKARKMLGYDPGTSLKEGVGNFVLWYKEFYGY